ncbi:MAG: cytochrome c peroxidase [Saprospiraceae bacterium]|nr:cytochrome c peroxidase [Saprospiraceae bacterium]
MKKYILLSLLSLLFICLSFTFRDEIAEATFLTGGPIPELPNTPFNYNVEFPEYFKEDSRFGFPRGNQTFEIDDNEATLGRVLFYDRLLSVSGTMSCASCHQQKFAFSENTPLSEGLNFDTKRNSIALADYSWTHNRSFFWDARTNNLNRAVSLPLFDTNEIAATFEDMVEKMNNTAYYPHLFAQAYNGDPTISKYKVRRSLEKFLMSITTLNSKYDKMREGEVAFTGQEKFGHDLFIENCSTCHIFATRYYTSTVDLGLPRDPNDKGKGEWAGERYNYHYDIPSLRNVELSAPYMHNGQFESLEEVLDFYSDGPEHIPSNTSLPKSGFQFSETEKEAIIAFLKTLTDTSVTHERKWSNPFLKTVTNIEEQVPLTEINIYPNPASTNSRLFVTGDSNIDRYEVFDMSGQLLKSGNYNGELNLNISAGSHRSVIVTFYGEKQKTSRILNLIDQ